MIRKVIFGLVLLAVALAAACGGFWYWVSRSMSAQHEHGHANEYITIEKGSTPAAIVGRLVSEGIIANGTPVLMYLRFAGGGEKLQAGDYKFDSPISPRQVLGVLEKGQERTTRLVIPEGFTKFDIAKRLANRHNANRSDDLNAPQPTPLGDEQVLLMMNDTSLIKDLSPQAKNLEGYMYPSTYDVPPTATPEAIIKQMVDQFRKVWKTEWTAKAKAMGRTPHEIVTIASLIETETGVPAERPIVASVIYNRITKGIPLGIDMTNIYIAKMEGRWDGTINKSDLEVISPYNTRKFPGIPPGPISSVSETAIEAALNPAQTDYIYYVRNVQLNDGSHWFYASAADFEKGKAEYQRWLEKEREEKRANEANNSNVQP